jgi:DNA ligase-associated metallophosphoesterase
MTSGALSREIRGETLLLHPERALSWPAQRLLVVADTHFGKSSLFGRHGIAVPAGADALDRTRIDALLRSTGSERLLVLGDFLHGPVQVGSPTARDLEDWIQRLHPVQLWLVTGNHDRSAAKGWQAHAYWEGDSLAVGPLRFIHDADEPPEDDAYRIGGHIHPVVALGTLRKRRLRVPVFWERHDSLILPSFGLFTGGFRIESTQPGRVFAADSEQVMELRRRS